MRSFWLTAMCVVATAAAFAERPNIVVIVADDLGWTDLGGFGSGYYQTPNIDRLAATGMRFTAAYASPNCAPTRASLLTGRYSPRHGVMTVGSPERGTAPFRKLVPPKNATSLALDEITFAEVLGEAGYATAHMGSSSFSRPAPSSSTISKPTSPNPATWRATNRSLPASCIASSQHGAPESAPRCRHRATSRRSVSARTLG